MESIDTAVIKEEKEDIVNITPLKESLEKGKYSPLEACDIYRTLLRYVATNINNSEEGKFNELAIKTYCELYEEYIKITDICKSHNPNKKKEDLS